MARLTLSEFRAYFHHWLVVDYCYKMHDGIYDVPAKRWDEEVARDPVRLPMSAEEVDIYLGITKRGTLRRDGVRFASLFYNSPELSNVLRQVGTGLEVKFTVNPNDLSEVTVIHPTKNVPIRAYCTFRQYAAGLTLHQHRLIRTLRRKQCLSFTNEKELVAARDAFLQASADLMMRSNTRNHGRVARHQGGSNVQQPATQSQIDELKRLMIKPTSYSEFNEVLAEDTAAASRDDMAAGPVVQPSPSPAEPDSQVGEPATNTDGVGQAVPTPPEINSSIPILPFRDRKGDAAGRNSSSSI
jgi:hypothetical protein